MGEGKTFAAKKQNSIYETLPTSDKADEEHKGEYLTDRLASEAEILLQKFADEDTPFFLNFAFYNVHTPLMGKPKSSRNTRNCSRKIRIDSIRTRNTQQW